MLSSNEQSSRPSFDSLESFLDHFTSFKFDFNSSFTVSDSDELYNFLMKYSSPNQSESLPFLKAALILLLLHPLVFKSPGHDTKKLKPLRSILLQVIGRCIRRANRAQLKTLPITVPLLLPHLTESSLFQRIVNDLHVDLMERFKKYAAPNGDNSLLYNDPLTANLLIVFDFFYLVNESFHAISYSGRLDPRAFYHSFPLNFHVCEDYAHWRELNQVPERHLPFAFCDFPWIFDLELKGALLLASNGLKQRHHLQDAFFRAIFDGVQSTSLNLAVRRGSVLQDAREQLLNRPDHQLAKQLRVTFHGEEGIDEGGLKKEFFQICWDGLFTEIISLFGEVDGTSGCFWFNPAAQESSYNDNEYKFIGILLALAIYNGVLVAPRFPLLLFKKLLNWPLRLEDFSEIDQVLVRSIRRLQGDNVMGLYHVVPGSEIELIPNGSNIPVTTTSLSDYISDLTFHLLTGSIDWQFSAFRRGFESISGGSVIYGYRPDELFSLAYGSDDFDISELTRIAVYEGGYHEGCPPIIWLWDCLINRFTTIEQRDFLAFVTGSARAPLAGLAQLKSFTITRASTGDTERLPTAHTCFNTLLLPEYCDAVKLENKLKLAIKHHTGFGLI